MLTEWRKAQLAAKQERAEQSRLQERAKTLLRRLLILDLRCLRLLLELVQEPAAARVADRRSATSSR